ncbi:hypothetical protein ENUP19_0275G0021 [Entamoeba nuttalli]|uniref:Uncharacterized protein n=1 Tax=Entamoeba nuttalli TaxID=412467 RepID=A0ABQ0DTE7_9EUKA
MECENVEEQDIWKGREELLNELPSDPLHYFDTVETTILNEHNEKVIPTLEKIKKRNRAVIVKESEIKKKKVVD